MIWILIKVLINEEKPDYTLKMWFKNYERIIEYIRELDRHFNDLKLFVNRQYLKMQKILKVHMRINNNLLTSQNSSPVGRSLSGIIFNLGSSLTNEWTRSAPYNI